MPAIYALSLAHGHKYIWAFVRHKSAHKSCGNSSGSIIQITRFIALHTHTHTQTLATAESHNADYGSRFLVLSSASLCGVCVDKHFRASLRYFGHLSRMPNVIYDCPQNALQSRSLALYFALSLCRCQDNCTGKLVTGNGQRATGQRASDHSESSSGCIAAWPRP